MPEFEKQGRMTASEKQAVRQQRLQAKGGINTQEASGFCGSVAAEPPTYAEPSPEMIQREGLYRELGLSDEEYARVTAILGRLPNYTETGIFGVMWSEHVSYKHSKPVLKRFPTEGPRILIGPGEGAGVVDIGDGQACVFKIESHNHPSAIEPYQGAATGVGGIIRDVFSMGARPVALLNSLRFGSLDSPRVRYLFEQVVAGIAGYGNCIGIPTVGGEVAFSPAYEGNPLVNAMCVGLLKHDEIQKAAASGEGNLVVYVGASTGRDGIHGATFASEALNERSEAKRPAVQVGDPFTEKKLMEACLEITSRSLAVGIQDMGAAGLTCSSTEMAAKGGCGMDLDLDRVPQREDGMTPYEMMLSESQERMLLVVRPETYAEVEAICRHWEVNCAVIGRVTTDGGLRLFHRGRLVAELPVGPLAEDTPVYVSEAVKPAHVARYETWDVSQKLAHLLDAYQPSRFAEPGHFAGVFESLLATPTVASKAWVYRQYDYRVGTQTVVTPGSDAAVLCIRGTEKALAVSTDGNAGYVYLSPRRGGAVAVAEAARNLVCSGAEPLALTDGLNYGSPEKPEVFWQLQESVEGMREACLALSTPVVGGNVSLYNETHGEAIFPTPVVGMVGLITRSDHITTTAFKNEGDHLFLLGETHVDIGGSQYQQVLLQELAGPAPAIDLAAEKRLQEMLLAAIRQGWVASAHDLSEGGLAVALAESAIAGEFGAFVEIPAGAWQGKTEVQKGLRALAESVQKVTALGERQGEKEQGVRGLSQIKPQGVRWRRCLEAELFFFSESQSRVLASVRSQYTWKFKTFAKTRQVPVMEIGMVREKGLTAHVTLRYEGELLYEAPLTQVKQAWEEGIPCRMHQNG